MSAPEPVLCLAVAYGGIGALCSAWFTTLPVDDQTGSCWDAICDDYMDVELTQPSFHRERGQECRCDWCMATWDGMLPKWRVGRVIFTGPFITGGLVLTHTPRQINARRFPWVETNLYGTAPRAALIPGMPISEFVTTVRSVGGRVYRSPDEVWEPVSVVPPVQIDRRGMNIGGDE